LSKNILLNIIRLWHLVKTSKKFSNTNGGAKGATRSADAWIRHNMQYSTDDASNHLMK